MAVTLRLARMGQKKRPAYRVVAAEKTSRRDGRFLEILGFYNPMSNPPVISLKEDRVRRWIGFGAQTSLLVENLIKKQIPGLVEQTKEGRLNKLRLARRKRKERAASRQSAA